MASKINFSINEDLLERADKYCEQNYISRSGLISLALTQYLTAQEVASLLRGMSIAMQKIANTGTIDEETKKQLEEFEIICNALVSK